MLTIYITESANDCAEIILSGGRTGFVPLDTKRIVANSILASFYNDWVSFVSQARQLKSLQPKNPAIDDEIMRTLVKKGAALASILFGADLPENLFMGRKSLLFSVDPAYANIPFELIEYRESFIVDSFHVLRQIRDQDARLQRPRNRADKKLFIMNSAHSSLLDNVLKEKEIVASGKEWSVIDCAHISESRFIEEIHDCRFIHFAGHTDADGIPFAHGKKIPASSISRLNLGNVDTVFFNSCFSSHQNPKMDSLAQAFVKAGVKNYIGYSLPVRNDIAAEAAALFWKSESRSIPIHRAIARMRTELKSAFGEGDLTWVILNYSGTLDGSSSSKLHSSLFRTGIFIGALLLLCSIGLLSFRFLSMNHFAGEKSVPVVPPARNQTRPQADVRSPGKSRSEEAAPGIDSHSTADPRPAALHENQASETLRNSGSDLERKIDEKIRNQGLRKLMLDFLQTSHPFYSKDQKERFVDNLIDAPMKDSVKIMKLNGEFYREQP